MPEPENQLIDVFEKGDRSPLFGEISSGNVSLFNAIRQGSYLQLRGAGKNPAEDITPLTIEEGGVGRVSVTHQAKIDFPRNHGFTIVLPDGQQKTYQDYKKDDKNYSLEQFFTDITKDLKDSYLKQEIGFPEAQVGKFLNIFGKYFHQAGISAIVNTYLSELAAQKELSFTGTNHTTIDLSLLRLGTIKIQEKFIMKQAAKQGEIAKTTQPGQPIAEFTFPFKITFNPSTKITGDCSCQVVHDRLRIQIHDQALMDQTFSKKQLSPTLAAINKLSARIFKNR